MSPHSRSMPRRVYSLVAVLAVLVGLRPAWGQDQDPSATGEITLSCAWFGVGGVVRAGDWVGLRLGIKDSSDRQREVLIRIPITDPDGDRINYERTLTTNPGVNQPLWVYLRLPARFRQNDLLTVQAFAAIEQAAVPAAGDQPTRSGYAAGRLLGQVRIPSRGMIDRFDGMIGIAGPQLLGLGKYTGIAIARPPMVTGHERTEIITRLDADSLPDRWMGLWPYDVLVWHQPPPGTLPADRAEAIREWVQRGGHLVIVLPRVGQTWTDEANNPLFDITPRVRVDRREGVGLAPYASLITTDAKAQMPTSEVLQLLTPLPGTTPEEAIPILEGPASDAGGREIIAARRLVGTGMVTMIGLDVASRWMQDHGAPDPQLFWHRILGRRGELLNAQQYTTLTNPSIPNRRNSGLGSVFRDSPTVLDSGISAHINMTGEAAAGVLMGFVVFSLYWLVAGPLGYALLKRTGYIRHAWVAFSLAAGVFTALAWGGATVIRPSELDAKHLSVFDHVYGQNVQRARSFVNVHVPQYGEATLAIGDPLVRSSGSFHNTLIPFDTESSSTGGFPDARGYRVESKNPDQITFPSRSTVKQFQIDWAGGAFKMPRPVNADGSPGELRIEGEAASAVLRGLLVHELPGPLTDVTVIVIQGQKQVTRSDWSTGNPAFLASGSAVTLAGDWAPGDPLDLSVSVPIGKQQGDIQRIEAYLKALTESRALHGDQGDVLDTASGDLVSRLKALTFFHQLQPPDTSANVGTNQRWIQRKATHGMDLSAWFTQPCIIVVGFMEKAPCPAPLFVSTGGSFRAVKSEGTTLVRWVYPLAPRPPGLASPKDSSEPLLPGEGGEGGDGGDTGGGGGE